MSTRWVTFIFAGSVLAAGVRAAIAATTPETAYYVQTAIVLVSLLAAIVAAFAVTSFGAVKALELTLVGPLRRSYALFLGWNMLRSQRASVPWTLRLARVGRRLPTSARARLRWGAQRIGAAALCGGGAALVAWWAPSPITWAGAAWHTALFWGGGMGAALLLQAIGGWAGWWAEHRCAKRGDPVLRLRAAVTVPNFISMVGVGVGVWALILVLSVMSGFQSEVRRSILATDAHVLVQPKGGTGSLDDALGNAHRLRGIPGVQSAEPYLEAECMIASAFNSRVQLTVRGVEARGGIATRLARSVVDGSIGLLEHPERLVSFRGLALAEQATSVRQSPQHPAPTDAPPPALDGQDASPSIAMPPIPGGRTPGKTIEMPRIPGPTRMPSEHGAAHGTVLIADPLAQELGVGPGDTVTMSVIPRDGGPTRLVELDIAGVYAKPPTEVDRPDAYVLPKTLGALDPGHSRALVTMRSKGGHVRSAFAASVTPDSPDLAAIGSTMLSGALDALTSAPLHRESGGEGTEPSASRDSPDAAEPGGFRVLPSVALGAELADSLRVRVGDEVQLISLEAGVGPMGVQPKASAFRVAAIFQTGVYDFDLKLAYTGTEEAQRFFDFGAAVNRIEVRLDDPSEPSKMRNDLIAAAHGPVEVLDWKALNRNLFSALQLEKIVMFLVLGLIIAVASFNIVASLAMLIQEKSTEIAILRAMGGTRGAIRRTFLTVGVFVGAIGSITGTTLGLVSCWLLDWLGVPLPPQYYIPTVPVEVNPAEVLAAATAAVLLSLLATLGPAGAAARLRPVEGLRYE